MTARVRIAAGGCVADVTGEPALQTLFAEVAEAWGGVDVRRCWDGGFLGSETARAVSGQVIAVDGHTANPDPKV